MLITRFLGRSVPVIGVGITLDHGSNAPNTVLAFAIVVALGSQVWMGIARAQIAPG